MFSLRKTIRTASLLLAAGMCCFVTGCIATPDIPTDPMGIREVNGRVQILVCSSISVDSIQLTEDSGFGGGEGRVVFDWAGTRAIQRGGILDLGDLSLADSSNPGVSFADIGLEVGSKIDVTLIDNQTPRRNQIAIFSFSDPLPTGRVWQGSYASEGSDPCG